MCKWLRHINLKSSIARCSLWLNDFGSSSSRNSSIFGEIILETPNRPLDKTQKPQIGCIEGARTDSSSSTRTPLSIYTGRDASTPTTERN